MTVSTTVGERQSMVLRGVQGLHSARSTLRINQIDRIRAFGIGDIVSLPQLVVCGDQSSGKSSVLEGITDIPFPRKDGLCTRFPTEIILRHNSATTEIVASIQPHSSRSHEVQKALRAYRRTLANMSELPTIIEEVSALMRIRGYGNNTSGNAFANDVLRIEVTGETGLNLTIVDLPGLISVANEEQTEYDIQVVKAMVESYVGSSRAIVLAVIQATNDIANQVIVQLARQHDPEGRRTVGIITKPDLINEGGEANLAILAANQANIKLNLGFFLLKNPTPAEIESGITAQQRSQSELSFFMNPVWQQHHLDMSRVGVEKLRLFLQDLLDTHIEKELPKVVDDIKRKLRGAEKSLASLGQERPTISHVRIFLTQISMNFSQLVHAALDGNYHGVHHDFFEDVEESRLRAVVHQMNGGFAVEVNTHGKKRVVTDRPSSDGELDQNSIVESNEKQLFLSKSEMMKWVKTMYLRTRGRELPGNYNHVLLAELFLEQSSLWVTITKDHVESVLSAVMQWLRVAVAKVFPEDGLGSEVIIVCSRWMEDARTRAFGELDKLGDDERRQPITYNHYYTDNVQKSRHDSLHKAVEGAIREAASSDYLGKLHISNNQNDLERFLGAMKRNINFNMDDQACTEALAGLDAYYKVAMKTYVDNVCRQVIERHVIAPLPQVFSPATIACLEDDELLRIGAEPESQKLRRAELTSRAQNLRRSLKDLQRH